MTNFKSIITTTFLLLLSLMILSCSGQPKDKIDDTPQDISLK